MQNNGANAGEPRRFSFEGIVKRICGFGECQIAWWKNHQCLLCFLVLFAVLVAMFCREPSIFLSPRIWAEEGTEYYPNAYRYAHSSEWHKGLTFVSDGYTNVWTCVACTVAANFASVKDAPNVMLLFALIVQFLPFVIILWSRSSFWESPVRKAIGVLILLLAPLSGETWLNVLHSKMHFAVAVFLLLIEDVPETTARIWSYRVLLVLAGLTGPASCVLTPLFLVEAYCEKHKERIVQATILMLCTVIQLILVRALGPNRVSGSDSLTVFGLTLGTQCFGPILFGYHNSYVFSNCLVDFFKQGGLGVPLTAFAFFSAAILFFVFLAKGVAAKERRIFPAAFFILTFVSVCAAVGEKWLIIFAGSGGRYFWAPNVILLILVLARIHRGSCWGSRLATVMLAIALVWGVTDYRHTACYCRNCPSWRDEVEVWKKNPRHKMVIWPEGWTCKLDRTTRR